MVLVSFNILIVLKFDRVLNFEITITGTDLSYLNESVLNALIKTSISLKNLIILELLSVSKGGATKFVMIKDQVNSLLWIYLSSLLSNANCELVDIEI